MGKTGEADALMKEANGLCQPSIWAFRLGADWEQATPLFERAGHIFKVASPPASKQGDARSLGSRGCVLP